jgi:hypothetical protein
MKLSQSKRMWATYVFGSTLIAVAIFALIKGLEASANISLAGAILIITAYLGIETIRKSQ